MWINNFQMQMENKIDNHILNTFVNRSEQKTTKVSKRNQPYNCSTVYWSNPPVTCSLYNA